MICLRQIRLTHAQRFLDYIAIYRLAKLAIAGFPAIALFLFYFTYIRVVAAYLAGLPEAD